MTSTREKEVILQEIAGIKDSPDELAYDLIQEAAYPDQPVGRPIIGTPGERQRDHGRTICAGSWPSITALLIS